MAFAGIAVIMGGNGFAASLEKLPGMLAALGGSIGFAIGTVLIKKYPLNLPPLTAVAWQAGLGSLPVAIIGLGFEHTDVGKLTSVGWILLFYSVIQCIRGNGEKAPAKPWEGGQTLEWTVPSPAPYHTFETPPEVR